MSRHRLTPVPARTVAEELHKSWLENKRKKDAEKIVSLAKKMNEIEGYKRYPTSKPTVEKAILYGYCLDDNLPFLLTTYFNMRNDSEEDMAATLTKKITTTTTVNQ